MVTSGERERGESRQGEVSNGISTDNVILGRVGDLIDTLTIYTFLCVTVHKKVKKNVITHAWLSMYSFIHVYKPLSAQKHAHSINFDHLNMFSFVLKQQIKLKYFKILYN